MVRVGNPPVLRLDKRISEQERRPEVAPWRQVSGTKESTFGKHCKHRKQPKSHSYWPVRIERTLRILARGITRKISVDAIFISAASKNSVFPDIDGN